MTSVPREEFTARVEQALRAGGTTAVAPPEDLSWDDRCRRFEAVLAATTHG